MADLMTTPSSSSLPNDGGGGGGGLNGSVVPTAIIMDAQSVTASHHHQQPSPLLISSSPSSNAISSPAGFEGGGGGVPSSSLSSAANGTITKSPHPHYNNNGQQMSCIVDGNCSSNNSSSNNCNNAHHHHHFHNNNKVSPTLTTVTTVVGTGGGLSQHNRNHSYPLIFTRNSGANTNNSNGLESTLMSSSVQPEMDNNVGGSDAPVVRTNLPSPTTMDILNLDFVNGNSSYCHNSSIGGKATTSSPLSCWPPSSTCNSHLKTEQTTPQNNSSSSNCSHPITGMTLTNNNSPTITTTTGDSPTVNNVNGKVPGEIPDSVMKYLLTKTDSVDSTKSAHSSSSGSSPSSNNSSSFHSPNSALSQLSEKHHNNKRLQEFLVDLDTLQSTTEIAKVLENFNAILEKIEQEDDKEALEGLDALTTPLRPTVLQCPTATVSSTSRIKNSVETLADLLLSGCGDEEDDLLIIIDENDSDSLQCCNTNNSLNKGEVSVLIEDGGEDEEMEDDVSSLVEIEADMGDLDQEEGYESDTRPIVRASMRKLRPVKILANTTPSTSTNLSHNNYNSNGGAANTNSAFATPPPTPVTPRASSPVDIAVGHATALNSTPIANKIIVTSLINSLNSSAAAQELAQRAAAESSSMLGQSSASSTTVGTNPPGYPTNLDVLHGAVMGQGGTCTGGQMGCHSRSHSNSSQIIQFHQNPVIVSTNPAGFPEVTIGNSNINSNGGTQIPESAHSTYDASNLVSTSVTQRGGQNTNDVPSEGVSGSSTAGTSSNAQSRNEGTSNNTYPSAAGTSTGTGSRAPAASPPTPGTTTSPNNASSSNNNNGSRTRARAPQAGATGSSQQRNTTTPPVLRVPAGRWPHRLSSVLAVVGCTLGLNNICRFSLLSVQYGANFILQFIFLSFVFGIPLLTFHMSIGQYLSSGIIDMWKISPIFQGIGVGLVISQAMIGIYTTVGVSWIFIYFRDSFITRQDQYRWGKCVREFGDCDAQNLGYDNGTTVHLYNETVPDYFNAVVLQRTSPAYPDSAYVPSSLKFTVAFNLAVVWMLVFVSLSKGLKSYGKVVHGFVLAPVAALFVLAFKMVNLVQAGGSLFGQTEWSNFFFSSQTWVAAARETFFTWGLLGACVMQITAHNRHAHSLKSDSIIVIMVTLIVLMLSAFIGNACYSILTAPNSILPQSQFAYVPSSFESKATYRFLEEIQNPDDPTADVYDHQHISFLMGVRIIKHGHGTDIHQRSGYQVLRLATELFPATMAVLSQTGMSSFWTVLFYFAFVLFGIAQQIAIWHCVIKGIIAVKGKVLRSWETTITFFVCGLGFVLGLPLCTETGIFIQYFMDYAIGSGWWIMVLYLLELIAVFIVRGAPYCGENIVTVLINGRNRVTAVLAPLISFIWNVIMPVAILVLSIASFKNGNIRELYDWNPKHGYRFWPSWTREVGSLIQLVPILAVPFVAILQSCRYLSSGPPDLFDRMQQLYRPNSQGLFGSNLPGSFNESATNSSSRNGGSSRGTEDPPPKYTPPPSYSTATGAKIAKFLRNSFRRSLRRLSSPGGPSTSTASPDNLPPPPNYASVILEINSQRGRQSSSCAGTSTAGASNLLNPIMVPPPTYDESTMTSLSLTNGKCINKAGESSDSMSSSKLYQIQLSQTLGRSLAEETSKERASLRRIASDITSRDIARMLRQSLRRNNNRDSPEASTSAAAAAVTTLVQRHAPPSSVASGTSGYSANSSPGQGLSVTIPTFSGLAEGSTVSPCDYTFGPNSLEKVERDLEMLNDFSQSRPSDSNLPSTSSGVGVSHAIHSRQSSSSSTSNAPVSAFGFNFGFNRARNRNSNDSQLALITSGVYEDLSVTSGCLMGALVDGDIEIDQFTQLNLPRHDSLSQLNVLDLGNHGNVNPTFQIHNATISSSASPNQQQSQVTVEQRERVAADSEA